MAIYSDPKKRPIGMTADQLEAEAAKVPASVTPALARPLAPNKNQDAAYSAGASVRRFAAAPTAWDSMGQSYMAQSRASSQVGVPVRSFARGLVGAAPSAPPPVAARPIASPPVQTAPVAVPATPTPRPGASSTQARKSPSQSMTLDQANAAEVNARTSTQTPVQPTTGAGAPSTVGGAAPVIRSRGKFGETVFSNTGSQYGNAAGTIASPPTTVGSVNQQNFGNPVVPQAPGSIARPGVASTFGLSVNDPRIDDQRAIARPQLGPNQLAGGGTLRGPDAMAEAYNSREDREARQKQLSELDSQRFRLEMIAGNPGRRGRAALEALGQNAQQQAALIAAGEKLSADAAQGRANRANVLANTGMEQAGQTQRQQMAGDVAREGNFLDYNATNRATDASLIARPTMQQAADGSLYSVTGTNAAAVIGPDGQQIRAAVAAPQQRNYGAESDNKLFADLVSMKVDGQGNPLPNAVELAVADMQKYKAAYLGSGQQAKPPAGYPNAKQAPDGKWYVQKDGATYLVN